ncbi:YlxR family protein [Kutzneria viridogrisea]|uniref:YlxR family protein n=1 Tax=Kutzneria viridogrisea TaxID=47990 RepID=UPI001F343639|nr:YlxR family protein [Kutzneria albida]
MGGAVLPDPRRRLPGRGAWVHPDPDCLRTAERRRAFPRAFRLTGALDLAALAAHIGAVSGSTGSDPGVPGHDTAGHTRGG